MPDEMRYPTEYQTLGATHYSYVWAEDEASARDLMAARGLGERPGPWLTDEVVPSAMVPIVFAGGPLTPAAPSVRPIDLIHAVTWLSFLAVSSGSRDIHETLGDTGVLHQVVHGLDALERAPDEDHSERSSYLVDMLREIEESVPGFLARVKCAQG